MKRKKYELIGVDAFSNESYELGKFKTKREAMKEAVKRLKKLEKTQPSVSSGGQAILGIQDRVYIARPNGTLCRITL